MLPASTRVLLHLEAVDMRKGFDSLAAMVTREGYDVFSGDLYVFLSRRRNRVKILAWDDGGFLLWNKRLERGQFALPSRTGPHLGTVTIDARQLALLLDGVDYTRIKRPKRWMPGSAA